MNLTCSIPNHNNSQIMMVCLNEHCQSSKLLCKVCIYEDLHVSHNTDLSLIRELPEFLKQKSQDCESFINQLQKQMDSCQELLTKIKCGIRQKYQIEEGRINNLNYQQANQAIIEILKFKDQKDLIAQELIGGIVNFNQMLNNIYQQLELDLLCYRNISDQDKDKAKELYNEGYNLYYDKKYQEAIEKCDQSLALNPYDNLTLWCKGECLRLLKKYNEALPWLDKALEIDQKHVLSLWSKGDCLRMLNKYNEALPWFDKALEIDSKHVNSLSYKGECLRMLNKFDEALPWLDKALNINPNHEISLGSKAHILKEQKKFKEAIIFYDKALAIDSTWNLYINGKKYCLEQLGLQK